MNLRRIIFAAASVLSAIAVASVIVVHQQNLSPRSLAVDCERFKLVALNAYSVANPDVQLDYNVSSDFPECSGTSARSDEIAMPVRVGPRWREALSLLPVWRSEIRQSANGVMDYPKVEAGRLANILTRLTKGSKNQKESDALLEGMDDRLLVQAVVELKTPLDENEARKIWTANIGDVLLLSSSRSGGKPIGWEFPDNFCNDKGFNICDTANPHSRVAEFKLWVSQLRPEDSVALEQFGLNLDELEQTADAGKIFGFIVHGNPKALLSLSHHANVASMHIVSAAQWP